MSQTITEVLRFIEENDVKFIRLAFCDLFGVQKNISIMPSELERAFEHGIPFNASAVEGFGNDDFSDLFLVPDPVTLSVLPWRPSHGRVVRMFCSIKRPDGSDFEGCSRKILQDAVKRASEQGYICKIGSECEFYLFQTDEYEQPTLIPHDQGSYCDISPLDKGENVRREICLTLEEMGLMPESSHHEQGPGQNEIDFCYSDALSSADNFLAFKSAVKSIAQQNGLFASFMPKPLPDKSGSGMHINISLSKGGKNLFKTSGGHNQEAESFIAGILNKTAEITAFLNPLTNSYQRLGSFESPRYITWSHQNRSQLIRIPAADGKSSRMELRSPDPSCNPYLAFALLIHAGLDGIETNQELPASCHIDFSHCNPADLEKKYELLPQNLGQALERAENSDFVKRILPPAMLNRYIEHKRAEWRAYQNAHNQQQFALEQYFKIV